MNALEAVSETTAPYGVTQSVAARCAEQRVILHGISWATYRAIQRDIGESRGCRLAYDSGELEIMAPQNEHEKASFRFGQIIVVLVEAYGLECEGAGSLTCEREDLLKAIEPDQCFYIENMAAVDGVDTIDLRIHPPPDLMIEVDISTNSLNKLAICKALGVSEHWRYNGKRIQIHVLKNGHYIEVPESPRFPGFPICDKLPEFIKVTPSGLVALGKKFRAWVRAEMKRKT